MMNTRSHTRVCSLEVTSSSAPQRNLMGIEFLEDYQKNRFKKIEGREVQKQQMGLPHYY
jgi:hypothetical protein